MQLKNGESEVLSLARRSLFFVLELRRRKMMESNASKDNASEISPI